MGNSNWSGGRYWETTEAASIPAATVAFSDSIRDQVLGKFTTINARDTALAALPVGERAGCLAYVAGIGWSAYDGAQWRALGMVQNNAVRQWTANRTTTDGWPSNAGWGNTVAVTIPASQALPGVYTLAAHASYQNLTAVSMDVRTAIFYNGIQSVHTHINRCQEAGDMFTSSFFDTWIWRSPGDGGSNTAFTPGVALDVAIRFRADGSAGTLQTLGGDPTAVLQITRTMDF
jgi:hypothetical protein